MNKKLKVLSSVICGLVLSSGLALTSVQAASVQNNISGIVTPNAVIPGEKYSYYTKISESIHKEIQDYIEENGQSSTAEGIRTILLNNGISKTIANNISFSLLELADKTAGYSDFAFPEIKQWDIEVLTNGNGEYSLTDDIGSTQTFGIYAILSHQDIVKLRESYNNMPSGDIRKYFISELISKGIVSDQIVAKNIAEAIWDCNAGNWNGLVKSNENLLILQSTDGTTFVITRQAR